MPKGYRTIRGGARYKQATSFKEFVRERDGNRCQLCGCGVGQVCNLHYAPVRQLDVAHIIPWKVSYNSTLANVRLLCHPCNKREGHGTEGRPIFA